MDNKKEISELLLKCEENGLAPPYVVSPDTYKVQKGSLFRHYVPQQTKPVKFESINEEIFVVSDLHIASGKNSIGIFKGTENFFADDSFGRFLDYADSVKKTSRALLVINGDVFDFLRVVEYPGKIRKARLSKRIKDFLRFNPIKPPMPPDASAIETQFGEWQETLEKIGIAKMVDELKTISKKEKEFGLKTHDYKSVWKLHLIQKGHDEFFDALARWLDRGNRLIIVKGNHDTEWYWLAVRNYFRLILAERISAENISATLKSILPKITFIDDSVVIDEDFYIEHGHRYDKYTMILGDPLFNPHELNIPFGSFFNRYLLNRIELFLPFLDNVRPSGNVLPVLMKENFPLGLKVLFQHLPFTLRMLFTFNGRYIFFMLKRVLLILLALLLPIVLLLLFNNDYLKQIAVISQLWYSIKNLFDLIIPSFIKTPLVNILKGFGSFFLSYLLARLVSWLQLTEPDSLEAFARERSKNSDCNYFTMGHTHNPGEYRFGGGKQFYNTGTWIPVIELSNTEIREDKTYSFLHMIRDSSGKLIPANNGLLQRWNDNASRPETQILIQRK
jgi:UDP-2,3-diacylglucosamine pyrophosphatase LpxH